MKPSILILEDRSILLEDLCDRVNKFVDCEIMAARSSEEALSFTPDIALCDISLEEDAMTGIDVADRFNESRQVPIIFVTSTQDDKEVFDRIDATGYPKTYLSKPVTNNELKIALNNALNSLDIQPSQTKSKRDSNFLIRNTTATYNLDVEKDIIYLEADGNVTKVFITSQEQPVVVSTHMKDFMSRVSSVTSVMQRVSRSHTININQLSKIVDSKRNITKEKMLVLKGTDTQLKLSPIYRAQLMARFNSL